MSHRCKGDIFSLSLSLLFLRRYGFPWRISGASQTGQSTSRPPTKTNWEKKRREGREERREPREEENVEKMFRVLLCFCFFFLTKRFGEEKRSRDSHIGNFRDHSSASIFPKLKIEQPSECKEAIFRILSSYENIWRFEIAMNDRWRMRMQVKHSLCNIFQYLTKEGKMDISFQI